MEEEGEEDETKKRTKTTGGKIKRRKRVSDKPQLSSNDEKEVNLKEDSNEDKMIISKTDDTKENSSEEENDVSKRIGLQNIEGADSTPINDDSDNAKLAKTVSFSPSTEFLGDTSSADNLSTDNNEDVLDETDVEVSLIVCKAETIKSLNISSSSKKPEKLSSPEADRKHIVALTTVFLNTVETGLIPNEDESIGEEDEEINTGVEVEVIRLSTENLTNEDFISSYEVNKEFEMQSEVSKNLPSVLSGGKKDPEESPSSEIARIMDSPTLPPRNGLTTSPEPPPKSEASGSPVLSKKAAPILSAMKKMVEKPINVIKSKMESLSPTRKSKSGDEAVSPKNVKASALNTDSVTGSPPLPPRNKPDTSSPKTLRSIEAGGSPQLPPRNDEMSQILPSEAKNAKFSLRSFFSDDPKKFNSLQLKRINGSNVRYRESSLPPPDRMGQDGRKSPKIPPKTWMWEELRRTKLKGGYPWTHIYKGSFDEAKWKEIMEHEYEYVDPRPELLRPEPIRPQAGVRLSPRSSPRISPRVSPRVTPEPENPKVQRRFIRIKDSDQVIIPLHGSSDEEHNPDRYEDPTLIGQEEVGLTPPTFLPTPSPSPSRRKVENEPKLSEKLRTTAEQLGSKFKNISLPDKSKIRLPDKPKFLTEIPQLKLPEKPKFLTEKPKFLTEKPKFLTEKPKFLTERPKFLTEKPKFLTERPKFLNEKPKFLTEKPKFLKEGIKFPDTSKISMPSIKLPKARRLRPKRETKTSAMSEFGSDKNIFQTIKARTYPRFLNKKKRQGTKKSTPPPPPGQARFDSESLPSTPRSKRNDKWIDVYKQKSSIEETKVPTYANGESFHERYSKREAKRASSSSIVDSDREQASSGSSGQRHRAGVIEEIDSDEFFVRVKGISREDVQVSKYLSSEIREAFRSPKNALASLDKEDFDDEEPTAPHRSKKPKEYPRKEYNTFPLRPSRSRKGKNTIEKPPRRFRKGKPSGSLPSLDRDREFEMEVEVLVAKEPPMAPKRRKSAKDLGSNDHWTSATEPTIVPVVGMALETDEKMDSDIPPIAPVRKTRSRGTSLADEDRTSRGAESIKSEMQIEDDLNDDFHVEAEDDNKFSKELDEKQSFSLNIPLEINIHDSPAYSNVSKSRPPRPPPPEKGKPSKQGPHHRLKSKLLGHRHIQQLQTWKDQGVNFFFTYPRRAMRTINKVPKRPTRNYSTIGGPTRPPRRHKVFREPVYVDADIEQPSDSIPYIDDDDKLRPSKSEEAVGGMKGRPLPTPPKSSSMVINRTDIDMKNVLTTDELNLVNNIINREPTHESLNISVSEEVLVKQDDKMQSRPLPPPPRRKRGSSSTERKRRSTSEDINNLNDLNSNEEAINVRMTIDLIEPATVLPLQQLERSHAEIKEIIKESDVVVSPRTAEISQQTSLDVAEISQQTSFEVAEISQQTSFEVAEITVSVQTDPLPEGVIVDDTDEISPKLRQQESDEEPSIEKYLEKYGSEIKMLGRQAVPSKPTPPMEQGQLLRLDTEDSEVVEKERTKSINQVESDRNINKSETKIIDKSIPIERGTPTKEQLKEESRDSKPVDIQMSFPDRLHLSHLDVDSLSVSTLKASQIIVSDLTGENLQVTELTSRGGNLVVSGMELPPSFIESLASEISAKVEERLPQKEQEKSSEIRKDENTTEEKLHQEEKQETHKQQPLPRPESPLRPQRMTVVTATAPPTVIIQPSSELGSGLTPESGVLSSSDSIPTPRTTRNRGKKTNESTRIVDDSEDELASAIEASSRPSSSRSSPVRQLSPSPSDQNKEPVHLKDASQPPSHPKDPSGMTARQLLIELLKIWKNCVTEGFSACSNTVGAMFPEGQKRRDAQTAACVLFVIIIGLFALGFGTDNTVHYHHWDYMPPRM